jgi:threonyl-tRNA synthetase
VQVHLPDGSTLELPEGASGADAAAAIGPRLAKAALGVRLAGDGLHDLTMPLREGDRLQIVTATDSDPDALWLIRHDAAHVLATAVMELYPGVKISIGPPIEDGFYYDFEFPEGTTVSEADFERIEARMREHIAADEPFVRSEVPAAVAIERFQDEGQDYKVELIEDLIRDADPAHPLETVSLYTNGPFTDLCRGPHSPSTKRIKAFKLESVAGAYWRGKADNQMLTRIYGTAFMSQADLDAFLERQAEARARDHRKLGRELGLFMLSDISPGAPYWLPNGMVLFNELLRLVREENARRGYEEVKTPIITDVNLWRQSGHWDKYRDNMYFTEIDGRQFGLKPMNCPNHIQIYKAQRHSYRDLPVRYSEAGLVHRHEASGVLHGLLRVRAFTQDDAHIFCTEEQIEEEVLGCLDLGFRLYEHFDLEPRLELSTRPDQRLGSDASWDHAETALANAMRRQGLEFEIGEGEGTFYGPKIDVHMTDSIGRSWQLGTVQLDYLMPDRFELQYTGADDEPHRPVMIHRAMLGSYERFIGILIEHYAGEFPVWLAPVQAIVLPIAARHNAYAVSVRSRLLERGLRVGFDERDEKVGRKRRDAELRKIPYLLVVGDREAESDEVSVRRHGEGDQGTMSVHAFADRLSAESYTRAR